MDTKEQCDFYHNRILLSALGPQPSASLTMTSFPRVAGPFESPLESVCEIVARVAHRAIKGVKKDLKHQDEMSKCIVNPVV